SPQRYFLAAFIVGYEIRRCDPVFSVSRFAGPVQPGTIPVHRRDIFGQPACELASRASGECVTANRKYNEKLSDLGHQPLPPTQLASVRAVVRESWIAVRLPDAVS